MRANATLFSPEETLRYGNAFRSQYDPYLNYQPKKVAASTSKDAKKLELTAWMDYCHDLRLHLDIYPEDRTIYDAYVTACKKYRELREKYEATEPNLYPEAYTNTDGKMRYIYTPSPWIR